MRTLLILQQDKCFNFADKYIEFDNVILFIDMILHKPQVYRHLLFNRLKYTEQGIEVHFWFNGLEWSDKVCSFIVFFRCL